MSLIQNSDRLDPQCIAGLRNFRFDVVIAVIGAVILNWIAVTHNIR